MGRSSGQARTPAKQSSELDGYPKVFGKYVLVRPLARGGMGELFMAAAGETGGFEKMCVVKKVLHSVEDQAVHRRFLDEAKVVVRLNHANLVQVFDAGQVDEEYYLAMELVEGKDLRAVWNRCAQLHRRIPVEVAVFVVREILRGLEYAHDALALDLVHRDISPPNLLVGYRGEVKLTDFGLAKSAIKREMTSPGVVFGRYSYLAPEQAKGLPADRRTDIYACGIVLWELLTGRQLFPSAGRSHQQALSAVRNPKVRSPSALVPGIPAGLDQVVLKALAKEAKERYQNTGEFRMAMSKVLSQHFPGCDADRTGEFMRDIFAREVKTEGRDVADLSQRDFSSMRSTANHTTSISIGEALAAEGPESSAMQLRDSEIIELERARRGIGASTQNLRDAAKGWVGKIVAQRYRVEGIIGIGGMGAVFRAKHLALGKTFALKILHRIFTRDADIVARFMREARAATQTGHPNIIDIIDIGTTNDEDVFFVMELLEGRTLGEVINAEGRLAVRRSVHIARQICRAVAAAHEVGIIHRDLKSDNIILVTRGKDPDFVKVLDFGICKTSTSDGNTTSPGVVMGSPDYMAPEQGAGLDATVSSDVYAVGCIVYETLAGRLPFKGRNAIDVLMQKGAREADRVVKYRPEVPAPLADVLSRCLMRSPQDRPPSMRALEYELTRAVDGRATAVAAVLGLNMAGDSGPQPSGDPSPAASASFHRAAIASLEGRPEGYEPREHTMIAAHPQPQGQTQIAPAPQRPPGPGVITAAQVRASSYAPLPTATPPNARPPAPAESTTGSSVASGLKAMAFVLLGGLLASGLLLALSPETFSRLFPGDDPPSDPSSDKRGVQPEGEADDSAKAIAVDAGPGPAGDGDLEIIDGGDDDGEIIAVDDGGEPAETGSAVPPGPLTVDDLLAQAEAALAAGHWREPAEGSMAMALNNLALINPGHEALARLRNAAASLLLPAGEKAIRKKRWSEASAAYRDLIRVWPDHEEARIGLLDALHNEGRILARHSDHAKTLAIADEMLTMEPEDFRAMMLRAEALYDLERWSESKEAFGKAKRLNPRNKAAKKGWWRAHGKVRTTK